MNLAQLQDDVLSKLGEDRASMIGAYLARADVAGSVATQTADTITSYLNEAQSDIARNDYSVVDTATYSWPQGQQYTRYDQFTCQTSASATVLGIRQLKFGASVLTPAGRAATENWFPNALTDPQAQPRYYYEDGIEGIGVYPLPSATSTTVTAKCLIIPAPLVAPSDAPPYPFDMHKLLSFYACSMLCLRVRGNPEMMQLGMRFMSMYTKDTERVLDRLWRLDADLANDLLARTEVQLGQQSSPEQGTPS